MANQQITENQHCLPKMYSKSWADNQKRMFYYEPTNPYNKFGKVGIKSAEAKKWFYDENTEYQINEWDFEKIETPTERIIQKILQDERIDGISLLEKFTLSTFIYLQWSRTDMARFRVTKRLAIEKNIFDLENYPKDYIREEHTKAIFHAGQLEQIIRIFNMKWILIENVSECGFLLSDNPIYLQNRWSDKLNYMDSIYLFNLHSEDFTSYSLKAFIPLSPRFLLILHDPTLKDDFKEIPDMGKGDFDIENVMGVNHVLLKHCYKRVYYIEGDKRFIEKISDTSPSNNRTIKNEQVIYKKMESFEKIFLNNLISLKLKTAINGVKNGDGTLFAGLARFEIEIKKGELFISLIYNTNPILTIRIRNSDLKGEIIEDNSINLMSKMLLRYLNKIFRDISESQIIYTQGIKEMLTNNFVRLPFKIRLKQNQINHKSRKNPGNFQSFILALSSKSKNYLTDKEIDQISNICIKIGI